MAALPLPPNLRQTKWGTRRGRVAAFAGWSPPTRETAAFVCGFPKNERSNVDKDEEEALKKLAANLLSLTAQALGKAIWCKSAAWKSSPETPTTCS